MFGSCTTAPRWGKLRVISRVSADTTVAVSYDRRTGERVARVGGKTGQVLAPDVVEEKGRVTVTFGVDKLPEAAYTCQGKPAGSYVVTLRSPLGHRTLLDGACLHGEASTTSFCADGARRWPQGIR